jgi:hypothetical protein
VQILATKEPGVQVTCGVDTHAEVQRRDLLPEPGVNLCLPNAAAAAAAGVGRHVYRGKP